MAARFFQEEMRDLNSDLLKMAAAVELAISNSVEALRRQDMDLAQHIIDTDRSIDDMELKIEQKAINLLALQQPLAKDLRFIVTTGIKINSELERMADMAVNIAQRVRELGTQPLLKPLIDIPKLSDLVRNMVKKAMDSFVQQDASLAKEVIVADIQADKLKQAIQEELVNEYIIKDTSTAPRAVPLLLIARHLERIGDHATNIAEDIIYMVKAKIVRHHLDKVIGPASAGGADTLSASEPLPGEFGTGEFSE